MPDSSIRTQIEKTGLQVAHKLLNEIVPGHEMLRLLRCVPPTDTNLKELRRILQDQKWAAVMEVVELYKAMHVTTAIPVPQTFLSHMNLQVRLAEMLTDIGKYEPYLKLFIERFEAENELTAIRATKWQEFLTKETEKLSRTAKGDGPIHAAARQLNEGFLEWLLGRARTDVNLRNSRMQTALAILFEAYVECLQSARPKRLPEIKKLIERLVKAGADLNICDKQSQLPIGHLLKRNLEKDKDTRAFVEHCLGMVNYALVEIKTSGKARLVRFVNNATNVNVTVELLEIFLRYKDVEQFKHYWAQFAISPEIVKKVIQLLLHTALDQELSDCLRMLIEKNPSMIFRLANEPQDSTFEKSGVGSCLRTKQEEDNHQRQKQTRRRGKKPPAEVDQCNSEMEHRVELKGLLRKACKMGDLGVSKYAYLSVLNHDNLTPLDYGTYEFWKSFLDQCIEVKVVAGKGERNIRFILNCFDPCNHANTQHFRTTIDDKQSTIKEMSKNFDNHALGQRTITEMTPISQIAQSKELKPLLIHPVIHTFIMVKWMRLSHMNYLNLVLTILTAVVFGSFSLTACSYTTPNETLLWGCVMAVLLLSGREILQMMFLRKSYISYENVLDIGNIVAMICVLYFGYNGLVCSLVVIRLAWQGTFQLGSLPFNSISTTLYMFKTVSINFLKSFLLFIPLIGAFVYAFYLSYNESPAGRAIRDACTEDYCAEKNFNRFHTFWNATIKTLVMTTGELEASTLELDIGKMVLFLLFLFIAPIVIMNLINGLAVSDIAAIREEAELISISKKVTLLEQYERGVGSVRPTFLRHLLPEPFFTVHNSWIHVLGKDCRKIAMHSKHASSNPKCIHRTENEQFVLIPILPFFRFLKSPLNFGFFKLFPYMRLDEAILWEALMLASEEPTDTLST
ncbi:AGAP001011-PA-like protein [Anopheles sinensis]|uniref:AGAP001011-PA-like protein n=1 Tax=Anopheles sinensis TaxID=74873 RepID=A0A084VUS4_ANOSI|nr:AGAP001011-PA-like protein [Anopheles sinensis]